MPSGRIVTARVGLVDVMPTAVELLGLPPPKLPADAGRSLVPFLRGMRGLAGDYEMESYFPAYNYGWSALHGLVSGRWKYIEAPRPEL